MGELIDRLSLRRSVYVVYSSFIAILVLLFVICSYAKAFLRTYPSIGQFFSIVQLICMGLCIALVVIMYLQYKKAGVVSFHKNGLIKHQSNKKYAYADIIHYEYVSDSNKAAQEIVFITDDNRQDSLTALLDPQAFVYFQQGYVRVWGDFTVDKIVNNKEMYVVQLLEDVTSFKATLGDEETIPELVVTYQGIQISDFFYNWSQISRYEITPTGLIALKDTDNRTILLEPITRIAKMELFVYLLQQFIPNERRYDSENTH